MITGKDITLNDDGSRIVEIQSDSFTIQHKIDKDNRFDPTASIIISQLQDKKLVASYIIEMDGTRATFHRELGKIFHEVFRAILKDPFKRLEFVHCISGIWMGCLDTIGISGKVVTFQNTLTEPHLVLRYWLIGEEWVLIYNETIESVSMVKYQDDKSMFFHQDVVMAELFGRYSDITNPPKLNGLQRQIVDDHHTVFGNKDKEENTTMEKCGNTYTIAATDHFKCVRDTEPGMFRIYGSNNFCIFDIGIFEYKTRLDNAKDVMDGFRDLFNPETSAKARDFINLYRVEFGEFLTKIPQVFDKDEVSGIVGKQYTFQADRSTDNISAITWLIGNDEVFVYNQKDAEAEILKIPANGESIVPDDMIKIFMDVYDYDKHQCAISLTFHIWKQVDEILNKGKDNTGVNNSNENERNVIMHDEMVKIEKDTSNDPMWLFNFLVQKEFIDDESIIDLIYSARTLIRRKIRNGEFDLVHPQNMNDSQHVARSRVMKVVHTILYANELAEERNCVLHMGDRHGWETYIGSAFMIELVALFSGIVYAEEAEYRCKLLASPEGICRHEALESLFHKFIDHLRDNYNLIEERYHTDFTRILKIIMIADSKG